MSLTNRSPGLWVGEVVCGLMTALGPDCEFDFLAARGRSTVYAATANNSVSHHSVKTSCSFKVQHESAGQGSSRGLFCRSNKPSENHFFNLSKKKHRRHCKANGCNCVAKQVSSDDPATDICADIAADGCTDCHHQRGLPCDQSGCNKRNS